MVDATLVRHHPEVYDTVMAAHAPAGRRLIVEALAGLRFVRSQISRGVPVGGAIDPGTGTRRITCWRWKSVPAPAVGGLPPRAQGWELARYRAYQARLAGHTIGQTFGHAVAFLTLTGAQTAPPPGTSQPAAPGNQGAPKPEPGTCGPAAAASPG